MAWGKSMQQLLSGSLEFVPPGSAPPKFDVCTNLLRLAMRLERKKWRGIDTLSCALKLLLFHLQASEDITSPHKVWIDFNVASLIVKPCFDEREKQIEFNEKKGLQCYAMLMDKAIFLLLTMNQNALNALQTSIPKLK
ncbi:hypothetical protein SELMODRAFT_429298 [Selaginella moellendorffii]|uniref:Uncharacterized protein n=1 Tax=Selaginella moellendorffii TaxID=88036 RepID=D8T5Q3_SELML|nr:hypothetical protein SELMODRAFT_429298 [Selaginella moellendorffii]